MNELEFSVESFCLLRKGLWYTWMRYGRPLKNKIRFTKLLHCSVKFTQKHRVQFSSLRRRRSNKTLSRSAPRLYNLNKAVHLYLEAHFSWIYLMTTEYQITEVGPPTFSFWRLYSDCKNRKELQTLINQLDQRFGNMSLENESDDGIWQVNLIRRKIVDNEWRLSYTLDKICFSALMLPKIQPGNPCRLEQFYSLYLFSNLEDGRDEAEAATFQYVYTACCTVLIPGL